MLDWRGIGIDEGVESARTESRRLLGIALEQGTAQTWASAEEAVQRAIILALARLGTRRDVPAAQRLVRQLLTAPDTRARYVFLEDLLHWMKQ